MPPAPPSAAPAPSTVEVKVKYLHPLLEDAPPRPGTPGSAGIDLRACMDQDVVDIPAGGRHAFPTGMAIEITTPGVAGFVFSRSGLGTRQGLTVSQGVGVIDPDYRGEIIVSLLNTSGERRQIQRGERIAQLVLLPVYLAALVRAEELSDTSRAAGGFGHTGTV